MKTLALIFCIFISLTTYSQQNGMTVDQKTGKIMYDSIGKVSYIAGRVYRTNSANKTSDEIGINFPIKEKDVIQTDDKSVVKITLNDATIISIGPNSHFNFKTFKYDSKTERVAEMELKNGKSRIDVPVRITNGRMNINTRNVALGVRGTEFLMNQEFDENGVSREQIVLLKGELNIKTFGSEEEIIMNSMDHLILKKDKDSKTNQKMLKLTQNMYNLLNSDGISDQTMKPFLNDLNDDLFDQETATNSTQEGISQPRKNTNFWRNSLEKLNKKLQESFK